MIAWKLTGFSVTILVVCYLTVCESAGNYTIGFEKFGTSSKTTARTSTTQRSSSQRTYATSPPRASSSYRPKPNPTYAPTKSSTTQRPSSTRPNPTYRPQPNPTYRPKPNPTYAPTKSSTTQRSSSTTRPASQKPYPTSPQRPNPTYHPKPNPIYPPPKPNPTYWPPKTNPVPTRTTPRTTRRTTPKPILPQIVTPPPMWNIWSSNYAPNQLTPSTPGNIPNNSFRNDPTLFGLYTQMRDIVGVTLSQNGQSQLTKKTLSSSYPYYYDAYHYNLNREKVSNKIMVPYDSVGYCGAGTSTRTCVPGTFALCLLDWNVMCITYSTATVPCYFNTTLQCATGKVACNSLDPVCASMGNQMEVQTPCVANVTVTSPNAIKGSITQNSGPDPYAGVVSAPIELCATTILELKRLESPVGAIVGFLAELQKINLDFFTNVNDSQYLPMTTLPPINSSTTATAVQPVSLLPVTTPPATIQP